MGKRTWAWRAPAALTLAAVLALAAWAEGRGPAWSGQKEKEQRETPKKSGAVVVTNADLAKVKTKPAVANPGAAAPSGNPVPAGTAAAAAENQAQADVAGKDVKRVISTGKGAPARTAEIAASELEGNPKDVLDRKKADLESRWNAARERIGLLEVKLLALRQQFGNPINAAERERVGKELDALAPVLAAARLDEKKAKEELDKFQGGPPAPRK
jgi:hypothetical protein